MKHPFDRCQGVTVHVGREGTMRDLEGNLAAIPGLAQKDPFYQGRSLSRRKDFKASRTAALTEWRQLCAA